MEAWGCFIAHVATSASGSLLAALLAPPRCHCECSQGRAAPEPVLELLREQLKRCGPESLAAARPEPAVCPPSGSCAGGFCLGVLFGLLLAACIVLALLVSFRVRSGPQAPKEVPAVAAATPQAEIAEEARRILAAVRRRQ